MGHDFVTPSRACVGLRMMNDPPFVPPSRPFEEGQQYRLYFFNGGQRIERVHEYFPAEFEERRQRQRSSIHRRYCAAAIRG